MHINSSIRNKLIFAILIGCLIPYILGGIYLKSYTEDWLYKDSTDNTNRVLFRIAELIDTSLVNDMKQEVEMLSNAKNIQNAKYNLQNYTHFERNTFRYQPSETEKMIEEQFRLLKISHRAVNFVFLGTEDGGYMEYPRFQAVEAYEPRLRPWYHSTIHKDDVQLSEPYLTKVSNEMVVGFTKRIADGNGGSVGVLGLTMNLYDLTTSINNIRVGDSGYILLLSPQHKFLISPHHQDWIMKTPKELNLSGFEKIGKSNEVVFETKLYGVQCVLNVVTSQETGWHIISVVEKNEILQKARTVTNILLGIYIMTFVLIFLIVFQISKRFTQPILEISYAINRMTDFNFKFSSDLRSYAAHNDEIGTVATALVEMHDNYTEFIDQVNYIDQELKNIDVQKNELLKVEVSKRNPFFSVIGSMNKLLEKIHHYFDQLNFLALHDSLTGLPNRRQFNDLLNAKLSAGKKGAVILLDLDDFKGVNDTLGHVFGDRVIEAIAMRLAAIADEYTVVSRFGGDEFLVLAERRDIAEVDHLIHKIKSAFNSNIHIDNNDIEIRFSMGISLFLRMGRKWTSWL